MTNIYNMEKIKELRDRTGAGMVECKKALEESGGDIEKAIEILRKKGIAKAAKRGDRQANEGMIKVLMNEAGTEGYMVEVNSETDFVARNEKFQNLADQILAVVKRDKVSDRETLLSSKMATGRSVKEEVDAMSGIIGEKLDIKNCATISGATVNAYSHMGGRVGVLVSLDKSGKTELAYDVAMQIAAANPRYIAPENVPAEETAKEKSIYTEQLKKEGKPEAMIEKIMAGKINKFYEEVCLVKQEYIKDDSKKIQDILGDAKVEKFIVYSLTGSANSCGI